MNGQQHYIQAEQYLIHAKDTQFQSPTDVAQLTSFALIHAMLANAAATAIGGHGLEAQEWMDVAGTEYSDGT